MTLGNPEIPNFKLAQREIFADDRMFHFMTKVGIESNGIDGMAMFANTRWHLGYHNGHGYESKTMIGRYLGMMQWIYPYIGFDYQYKTALAGIAFTLPSLTVADFRIDCNRKLRFQLSKEDIVFTPRFRFSCMINTDKEYMTGLRYIISKYISLSTHWDSDRGVGAGVTLTY